MEKDTLYTLITREYFYKQDFSHIFWVSQTLYLHFAKPAQQRSATEKRPDFRLEVSHRPEILSREHAGCVSIDSSKRETATRFCHAYFFLQCMLNYFQYFYIDMK